MATTAERTDRRRSAPGLTLGVGAAVLLVVVGAGVGLRPIADNSFLTHLATGRLILESGVPRADPYSYTAAGQPWVVQSWLPSLLYGLVDRVGGGNGLRLLTGLFTGLLSLAAWRLSRPAQTVLPRVLATGFVVVIGGAFWAPRPLLVGLLCLAATLLVVEEDHDPRWLIPLFWLWTNSHGSFPLGLVLLATLAVGSRLDGDRGPAPTRALAWGLLGTVLAVVGPIGPTLLRFPVELLGRMDILQTVVEWQSPPFARWWARVFLLQVVVAVIALVRRPSWRDTAVVLVFVSAALLGLRNIPVASLVLVPVIARGLAGLGRVRSDQRAPAAALLVAAAVLIGGIQATTQLRAPAYDLDDYPMTALAWIEERDLLGRGPRVLTQDTTGNVIEAVAGTDAAVFLDDRYDMYPVAVLKDYLLMHRGQPGWDGVLDRYEVEVVVWERSAPLSQLLLGDDRWFVAYQDSASMVLCRRGSAAEEHCRR